MKITAPDWKPQIRRRLAGVKLRPAREAAIIEELAQYLDDHYAELLACGATEAQAYRQTLTELEGSELLANELHRAERQIRQEPIVFGYDRRMNRRTYMLADFWQDLRYGARTLLKNPGFTLIAVATLSLGIGANTAIFSVLYGVLLKPLPYPDPNQIVRVWQATPTNGWLHLGFSAGQLTRLRTVNQSFQHIGGYAIRGGNLVDNRNETQRIQFAWVTAGVFESLGIQPALGRAFQREDEAPGSQRVAVLSDEMWRRQYGGDANILGRTIRVNDIPFIVVGVMPPYFHLPEDLSLSQDSQLWLSAQIDLANPTWAHYLRPIARLKAGVRLEKAIAEVSAAFAQLGQDHPQESIHDPRYYIRVQPLHDDLVGSVKKALWVLVGAVGLVLLIACANVSSLMLARAAGRRKEIAVRAALGAGRGRLIRQLLTESLLIALFGGAVGVTLAALGVESITKSNMINVPRLSQVSLNITALLFTLCISLLAALLFGLAPAAQVSRLDLNRALREEGRGLAGSTGGVRIQRVLVVSEVALAVMLVIAAGLLLRSFDRLLRIDPGFNVKNLLTVNIDLPASLYPDNQRVTAFYDQLLERVRALPGVVSASATFGLPLTAMYGDTTFQIEGRPDYNGVFDQSIPPDRSAFGHLYFWPVTSDFFKTMGIALRQGRDLQASDGANAPPVVVINETMARRFWPNENPLGKRLQLFWSATQKGSPAEIIGIVRDVSLHQLNEETQPEAYLPQAQGPVMVSWTVRGMSLVVRTDSEPLALAAAVRNEVRALNNAVPVFGVSTAEQTLGQTVAQPRFNMILLGLFAVVALLLASVGIYGVLANAVRQRTHEIGVRLALGARQGAVFRLVIRQGMALAGSGIVIGLSAAFALTRYLESLLYQVKPADPLTFGGVVLLLLGVAFLACWIPARRATKVDPLVALHYD